MLEKIARHALLAACFVMASLAADGGEQTITLYTSRGNAGDKTVIKDFEAATGIKVNVVEGKPDELIEKIAKAEGGETADLFMTVDGGILDTAKEQGVFQKTDSAALSEAVPANLRDRDNAWVGVTTRARVVVYAKDRVKPEELSTYMALTDAKWKGSIVVRSSGALYNQSLLASLIAAYGEEKAAEWATGLVANFARDPKGNDRDQAKAVAAKEADLAIMNTYYLGIMLKSKEADEVAAAEAVGVFFPDQDGAGTHINICGIGLAKDAKNPEAAMKFVEYLLSVTAQEKLSAENFEFPVNPKAAKAPLLAGWGDFKTQQIDFSALRTNKAKAKELLEKACWK